jgi:hypothetical protein
MYAFGRSDDAYGHSMIIVWQFSGMCSGEEG